MDVKGEGCDRHSDHRQDRCSVSSRGVADAFTGETMMLTYLNDFSNKCRDFFPVYHIVSRYVMQVRLELSSKYKIRIML